MIFVGNIKYTERAALKINIKMILLLVVFTNIGNSRNIIYMFNMVICGCVKHTLINIYIYIYI